VTSLNLPLDNYLLVWCQWRAWKCCHTAACFLS